MTDRELVLELCKRLKLTEGPVVQRWPRSDAYYNTEDRIVIGTGVGYGEFYAQFNFDGDKLVSHGVWE